MGRRIRFTIYATVFLAAAGAIVWWRLSLDQGLSVPPGNDFNEMVRAAREVEAQEPPDPAAVLRAPRRQGRRLVGHADGSLDVAVSSDGSRVLTASHDCTARLWDGKRLLRTLAGHEGPLYACALSADGKRAAAGGKDQYVIVWDADTGDVISVLPGHAPGVQSMAFIPDGTLLTSDGRGVLRRWNVDKESEVARLEGYRAKVLALAVTRDGSRAYAADLTGTLICWDLTKNRASWRTAAPLKGPQDRTGRIVRLRLSPDERRFYAMGHYATIEEWDAQTGELLRQIEGPTRAMALAVHPDGKHLAIGDRTGLFLWTIGSEKEPPQRVQGFVAPFLLHDLAFDPAGRMLVAVQGGAFSSTTRGGWQQADDGHVYVWDLETAATAPATAPASSTRAPTE